MSIMYVSGNSGLRARPPASSAATHQREPSNKLAWDFRCDPSGRQNPQPRLKMAQSARGGAVCGTASRQRRSGSVVRCRFQPYLEQGDSTPHRLGACRPRLGRAGLPGLPVAAASVTVPSATARKASCVPSLPWLAEPLPLGRSSRLSRGSSGGSSIGHAYPLPGADGGSQPSPPRVLDPC
jgi:hypothetical protein